MKKAGPRLVSKKKVCRRIKKWSCKSQ